MGHIICQLSIGNIKNIMFLSQNSCAVDFFIGQLHDLYAEPNTSIAGCVALNSPPHSHVTAIGQKREQIIID